MDEDIIGMLESQVNTLKARLDEAESSVKRLTFEASQARAGLEIAQAAAAAGVYHAAIPDVVNRALSSGEWRQDKRSGSLVRHNADGFADITASGENLTPKALIHSFRKEAGYYWYEGSADPAPSSDPASSSSPATGSSVSVENPWKVFNLTKQSAIIATDPQRALKLATEAGKPVIPGGRLGELPPSMKP